ncbi:hypothetical protein [Actinopolyspora halophila]|uniref:hypothetical protein n=1 Tax=Actinopolyspora halophila TaxID=1850 RepID=UPI0003740600|nr:hypothetical protein [Actinopolyspora halophila]
MDAHEQRMDDEVHALWRELGRPVPHPRDYDGLVALKNELKGRRDNEQELRRLERELERVTAERDQLRAQLKTREEGKQ